MSELIFQIIDLRIANLFHPLMSIIQIFGKTLDGRSVFIEVDDYEGCFYTTASRLEINKALIRLKNKEKLNYKYNVKFKKFYGFQGDKEYNFTKISSQSDVVLKSAARTLIKKYEVFESNKDLIVQFIHDTGIHSCGWVKINKRDLDELLNYAVEDKVKEMEEDGEDIAKIEIFKAEHNGDATHNSRCNIQHSCSYTAIHPADEFELEMAPFVICAYDIETISSDDGFPQARRRDDKIVSIASTFNIVGKECFKRVVLIVSDPFTIDENNEVIACKDEKELINKWINLINTVDPDIITQWNGFGFDDNYIHERLIRLYGVVKFDEDIYSKTDNDYFSQPKKDDDKTYTSLTRDQVKDFNSVCPVELSRFDECTEFVSKNLASAALGDSTMRYFDMKGRCVFDLMKVVRRDYKLISYKLDYVASYMFRDKISKYEIKDGKTVLTVNNKDLHSGQYIIILRNDGASDYECFDERKFQITLIDDGIIINEVLNLNEFKLKGNYFVCNVKDDVKPKEIFEKYRSGKIEDLKQLSLYNIQDCELCNKLCNKMFVVVNNIGMANVCYVPLNWIFNRGQSPKVYSLVSKKCKEKGYKIRTVAKKEEKEKENDFTYEGALVVDPIPGIYHAIFCLDYHALYPSSMICRNISHETFLIGNDDEVKKLMEENKDKYTFNEVVYLPLDKTIVDKREEEKKFKNLNCMSLDCIDYDDDCKIINDSDESKMKHCYFAYSKEIDEKTGRRKIGLLPEILTELLDNREAVKKRMSKATDPFQKKLLNGLQLAYKVTCNSVYGQLGCDEQIGPIALKDIAACTTATGREMLGTAKTFATTLLPKIIDCAIKKPQIEFNKYCDDNLPNFRELNEEERITKYKDFRDKIREIFLTKVDGKLIKRYLTNFSIAYGDTDSIFVNMDLRYANGEYVNGVELRKVYMNVGLIASKVVEGILPYPEELEYEKVLSPFISMAKKRYVGNFYTFNPEKPDMQYNMGFVLKRRDNARIVKYVIGGVVDRLLNGNDLEISKRESVEYVKQCLDDIIAGKFNIKMFIFSKSLKREYKNEDQIAHAVLAKRIGKRDPGNKPAPNDRIDFAYIVSPSQAKQGDKIETPEFIIQNNLQIDYAFYLEHQLMKPSCQIIELFNNNIKRIFEDKITKAKLSDKNDGMITVFDIDTNEEGNLNEFDIFFK